MSANDSLYKACALIGRFPFSRQRNWETGSLISTAAAEDARKGRFLELLVMEMVPDDPRPGGDYNSPRVREALGEIDIKSLENIQDGSGDYMLGVLYGWGLMSFPRKAGIDDLKKALDFFARAKEKGCPAAVVDREIKNCSKGIEENGLAI